MNSTPARAAALFAIAVAISACSKSVPEPASKDPSPATPVSTVAATPGVKGPDPLGGKFTMADVRQTLKGALVATIETNKGSLTCKLYDDKAPLTVANFVGLANGLRPFKDKSGLWVKKNAYDGSPFHRIIKGFMIQGGDAVRGNGSGEPGYVVPDEIWPGAKHDRPGQLCMANRGPDTNGSQFFITDAPATNLDGGYTIFGECSPEQTIHEIAGVATGPGDRPDEPVTIKSIRVTGN
jgi:peptidyl-prolyl cis-trans isomerase A (cyclophilin A)